MLQLIGTYFNGQLLECITFSLENTIDDDDDVLPELEKSGK